MPQGMSGGLTNNMAGGVGLGDAGCVVAWSGAVTYGVVNQRRKG